MIRRQFPKIIIGTVLAIAVVSASFVVTRAAVGSYFGQSSWYGYFTGIKDSWGGSVLSIKSNNQAIPYPDVASPSSLFQLLQDSYNSGSPQNKVGAAFIVSTMLGKPARSSQTITSDEWNDVLGRLNAAQDAGRINWNLQVNNNCYNSYYQGIDQGNGESNPVDDAFVNNSDGSGSSCKTDAGITIYNTDGSTYSLFRHCANPVGILSTITKIPTEDWSISDTASVPSAAYPGNQVTWTYTVRNNGPDTAKNTTITSYYNGPGGTGGNGSNYAPATGTFRTFYQNYTIPSNATPGSQICNTVYASPKAKGDNGSVTASACVTVLPPLNACRPITVTIPVATYYSTVTHNWNYRNASGSVSWPGRTIDVVLYVDGVEVAYNNSTTQTKTINLTSRYTDGNPHSVVIKERTEHVTSYSDITHTNHSGDFQVYHPCTRTVTTYGADGKPSGSYKVDCSYYTTDHSSDWTQFDSIRTSTAGPRGYSTTSPIGPCYDYSLKTSLPSFFAQVEAGATISASPRVNSSAWTVTGNPSFYYQYYTHTKSKTTQWQIIRMIVQPNGTMPSYKAGGAIGSSGQSGFTINNLCNYFSTPANLSPPTNCAIQTSGSTVFNSSGGIASGSTPYFSYQVPDNLAGTRVCFAFALFPTQSDPLNTSSSYGGGDSWQAAPFDPANDCIVIVKKPKVQIWGGDLWVGGFVKTSQSVKSGKTFGSWDEYGIFAASSISGMASGAAFAGSGLANSNVCGYSTLSFTNVPVGKTSCTGATGSIGNYSNSHSIPDVAASFPVGVSTPNVTPNLNNLQGIYTASGNVAISGGNIQKGQWIVVNAGNASVTITGNINYTNGQLHGIADIPQVVIIANNINIADNVTNIDAWLIAKTSINTCSSSVPGTSLTINKCNQPLTVNGPVMTGKLYLQRTAGSGIGVASGDPSEVFNLRPDAYLWSIVRASASGKVQTVYTTELPPRF